MEFSSASRPTIGEDNPMRPRLDVSRARWAKGFVDMDRFGFALEGDFTEVFQHECLPQKTGGLSRNQHTPGLRGRLEAGSEVDRIANCQVFEMLIVAYSPNDHRSAVDSNTHLEIIDHATELGTIDIQLILDIKGGADGTLRIVFMGERGAKKGKHTIT